MINTLLKSMRSKTFHSVVDGAEVVGSAKHQLIDPATANPWGEVTWSDEHVDLAVVSALRVSAQWQAVSRDHRAEIFDKMASLISTRLDEIALFETLANGKQLKDTKAEVLASVKWWQYYAGLLRTQRSEVVHINETKQAILLHEPLGVVALITPFNGAFSLGTWKLAPALAAGNTVIIKPPVTSPASTVILRELLVEAGVPATVIQIVQGDAAVGKLISDHPAINLVSFTGSTGVAMQVGKAVSGRLGRFVAEAGGKSAHIIFDDVDIEQTVTAVMQGGFSGTGQTCVAGSRVFVHESIIEEFSAALVSRIKKLKLGPPTYAQYNLGPIASLTQYERVVSIIDDAVAEGAQMLIGGSQKPALPAGYENGYWVQPTVMRVASNEPKICKTEVFGPVITLMAFKDEEEVLKLANDSEFGLAAGLWTKDFRRAKSLPKRLQAGTVWVNTYRGMDAQTPFGGYKMSGIGRENGIEGLREFQQMKSIVEDYIEAPDPFGIV